MKFGSETGSKRGFLGVLETGLKHGFGGSKTGFGAPKPSKTRFWSSETGFPTVGLGKTGWFVRENHVFPDGTRQKSGFLDQNPSPVNKKFRVSGGQGRVSRGFLGVSGCFG